MLNQTFNENNKTNDYLNDTQNNKNLSDEDYRYLIMISLIKNIISVFIFAFLIIIKYVKIYNYFFNEQNSFHILFINCFSGGFLFYISFLFSINRNIFDIYKKDLSFSNNNNININKLELISFIFGFLLIFFIRKILLNSTFFYIPLFNQNEISKIENNINKTSKPSNIQSNSINYK